ncbi:hypothetical protein B0O41_0348 [Propionibacteriaceae bacterium ES.041]|nr:hypothetical protein B0O41_0348 [Propionibacteriaceae bacterium ES.041]
MGSVIGWYAHHHGSGHLTRARVVAAALDRPVTLLTSRERPPEPGPFADWVELPPDWTTPELGSDPAGSDPAEEDPTARGVLHWVPRRHPGLRDRMAAISAWIQRHRPAAMVVDVSVEVAGLARLHGIPVITMVLPGERDDPPHRWVHTLADALLAPWPADWYDTGHLADHRDRLHAVGGLSRFAGRARVADPEPGRVLLLGGTGGSDPADGTQPWRTAGAGGAAGDGWQWQLLGGAEGTWLADPWPALCRAEVVVCQTGQNAVADAGAAGARLVAVPQQRPFGEQRATARALVAAGLAVGPAEGGGWPAAADWPGLLHRARDLRPDWDRWQLTGAAERAAGVIAGVADG